MSAHQKRQYTLIGAITVQEAATIHALYLEKTDSEIGEMLGRPYHHIKNYRRSKNLVKPQGNKKGWNRKANRHPVPKTDDGFCPLMQSVLSKRWSA